MKEKKDWTKWLYWFSFALVVIIIYKTLDNYNEISIWFKNFLTILMPFILGILVAYLFYIPCKLIEKLYKKIKMSQKFARPLSIFTVYILALILIVILINRVFPAISKSIGDLVNNLPNYYQSTIKYVENMQNDSLIKKESAQEMIYNLQKVDVAKFLDMDNISGYIKGVLGIANTIFGMFVTIVMSIYILLERTEILGFIRKLNKALFKKNTAEAIDKYFIKTNDIFFKFISSQILDGIIVGTIVSIAMWILGVKYALLLGLMIGLFNIIPYFGAIVAVIIATIITILTGGFTQALWMILIVIILQQIDANVINPKIVGTALKLSPILVIFSVTLAGAYFGVLGMFLAVPVIALIKILINDFIEYRIQEK